MEKVLDWQFGIPQDSFSRLINKMKIAVVHSFYSSRVSSGENNVVAAQVQALVDSGISVNLFSKMTDEMENESFYSFRSALRTAVGIGINPLSEIRSFKPDITHVHNLFPNFGFRWLPQVNSPIVSTLHNYRPICSAGILYREGQICRECIQKNSFQAVKNKCYRNSSVKTIPLAYQSRNNGSHNLLLKFSNKLIFLSQRGKSEFTEAQPQLEKKSLVIPNFTTSLNIVRPSFEERKNWIFVGRITEEKGIEDLVRQWPDNETLKIVGAGPLLEKLKQQAKSNIIFFGNLGHSETLEMISKSKALIFPSKWFEGMPTVYLEAISRGTPVIASEGNSVSDDIRTSRSGLVIEGNLMNTLNLLTLNWSIYSRNALVRFESTYSKEKWLEKTLDLYSKVIVSKTS